MRIFIGQSNLSKSLSAFAHATNLRATCKNLSVGFVILNYSLAYVDVVEKCMITTQINIVHLTINICSISNVKFSTANAHHMHITATELSRHIDGGQNKIHEHFEALTISISFLCEKDNFWIFLLFRTNLWKRAKSKIKCLCLHFRSFPFGYCPLLCSINLMWFYLWNGLYLNSDCKMLHKFHYHFFSFKHAI